MRRLLKWSLVLGSTAAVTALSLMPVSPALAQPTFVVNTTADPAGGSCAGGTGSLRQCLAAAAAVPGSIVNFGVDGVFALTQGQLYIDSQLRLQGDGPTRTIINGDQESRVFFLDTGAKATIAGVTVRNGLLTTGPGGSGGGGAGILDLGTLTLTNTMVSGNTITGTEGDGAGIEMSTGNLTITGSTISGNSDVATAVGNGGGIFTIQGTVALTNDTISLNSISLPSGDIHGQGGGLEFANTTVTATNVTISENIAPQGSGVYNAGTVQFSQSIIAGNFGKACFAMPEVDGNYNLDDDRSCFYGPTDIHANPLLGPLADNGGPTLTQALPLGSPAVDAVATGCPPPATDQRGITRPQGTACDIGAFELVQGTPPPTTTTTTTIPATTTTTSIPATTTTTSSTVPSTTTTTESATTTTTVPATITCVVTGLIAGPPKQQQVTVTASAGLASITQIQITNGTVSVAPFTPGTTGPVVITATKTDQSATTSWDFVATDILGNSQYCA